MKYETGIVKHHQQPYFLVLRLVNCPYVLSPVWLLLSQSSCSIQNGKLLVCLFGDEVNTNYYKLFPGQQHLTLVESDNQGLMDLKMQSSDGPCDCSQVFDSTTKTELLG